MPRALTAGDREHARSLDAQDPLRDRAGEFLAAPPGLIYLDGNSLGRPPQAARRMLQAAVDEGWASDLIRAWSRGWYEAPARVGDQIAALIGAGPGEVLVCDSTSVNLFKLTLAALQHQDGRTTVVSDDLNFPSDLYILQACCRLLGGRHRLTRVPSPDGIHGDEAALRAALDEHTALLTLSHVAFKSGYLYDAPALTAAAHDAGALVLWDLSHSAGALPIALEAWGVDLAVGCTYKYLNGGPGAPAFLYVRRELQERLLSPIWGWFGQRAPFAFELDYAPAQGLARFLVGSPPILSLTALEGALQPLAAAGLEAVRRKSIDLTTYLIALADAQLAPLGFTLGSPRQAARRGSHVSLRHPDGYRITQALIEQMNVLPDFREPDNLRLGLAPLYTSFEEVWEAVDRIRRVVIEGRHLQLSAARRAVT